MCAIIGALLRNIHTSDNVREVNDILAEIWVLSHKRGHDGRGFIINSSSRNQVLRVGKSALRKAVDTNSPFLESVTDSAVIIGNLRAEPTTEYVKNKTTDDQQPYSLNGWSIVHNGTIANDKELRTWNLTTNIDSAAIVEVLANSPDSFDGFYNSIRLLKGSFAILASHERSPDTIYLAANYRPIWYIDTEYGLFFASARDYFPSRYTPQMIMPYTAHMFKTDGTHEIATLYKPYMTAGKALVVCSGGLDSVVSATYTKNVLHKKIHLIHFLYGSRAEGPEVSAIKQIAKYLDAELTLFPLNIYSKGDSPLLDPDSKVAGGEEGAEFAHEWVPARNLVMLSVATAFAEARNIDTIVLGNNLEEAGAYPDNEPEFIARFNDILPFAVADGKSMQVVMPVGNMMKHEIVKMGHEIGAPMHLTWSCYRAGEVHCGTCGPCYMRRRAFEINGIPEVIHYANETIEPAAPQ